VTGAVLHLAGDPVQPLKLLQPGVLIPFGTFAAVALAW